MKQSKIQTTKIHAKLTVLLMACVLFCVMLCSCGANSTDSIAANSTDSIVANSTDSIAADSTDSIVADSTDSIGADFQKTYSGRFCTESNVIYVNEEDIDFSDPDQCTFIISDNLVMANQRKVTEHLLDFVGVGIFKRNDDGTQDDAEIENATLINKGKITVYTKDIFEKYKDQIKIPNNEDEDRIFHYIRFQPIRVAGVNCTVINDGEIEIVYDHDETAIQTVYGMGIAVDGGGNTIINNGTIKLSGRGSQASRGRGIASMQDDLKIINNGTIISEVEIIEELRGITTGGTNNSVINEGTISVSGTGTTIGITRYGNSTVQNNGTINVTERKCPIVPKDGLKYNYGAYGIYDALGPARVGASVITNRGQINMAAEADSPDDTIMCGIYVDFYIGADNTKDLNSELVNEGTINIKAENPNGNSCEMFFLNRNDDGTRYEITIGKWKTAIRDFSQKPYLFGYSNYSTVRLGNATIILTKPDDYVLGTEYPISSLVFPINCTGAITENLDTVRFVSADPEYEVVETGTGSERKVSLKKKED